VPEQEHVVEQLDDLARAGAVVGALRHAAPQEVREHRIHVRDQRLRIGHRVLRVRVEVADEVPREERRRAHEQVIERAAQAVDVRGRGHHPPGPLLRGHVERRPLELRPGAGADRLAPLHLGGEAEVGDLEHPLRGEQQVRRLDVAVADAERPGQRQRVRGLPHLLDRELLGQAAAGLLRRLARGHPGHVLHRDEADLIRLADLEDLHHVRVDEPRRGARLPEEALAPVDVAVVGPLRQELDRDVAAQDGVLRQVHGPHRAGAEQLDELEGPQPLSREIGQLRRMLRTHRHSLPRPLAGVAPARGGGGARRSAPAPPSIR
jgi:hypothetical protein